MNPNKIGLGVSVLLSSLLAQAQVQPNIGDALRQVPSQAPIERPEPTLPNIGGTALALPTQKLQEGGQTIEVKRFDMVGNRDIKSDVLQAQLADAVGKRLTLAELEALAVKLTRYYRAQGYFVARVYVPPQEVKDGTVMLRAVEGNYGKFILDNKSLVKDSVIQNMLDAVKRYDIVSLDTLERVMLLIGDTPGAQVVRADVMPGDAVGTSDFAVGTLATAAHQGYVLLDNHGSRYTGRDRVSFNWDWNSPTGYGDRLSVSGLGAQDLLNGRVAYAIPLGSTGLRGEVSATKTSYSLGDRYSALDALGTASGYDLNLSYPIRQVRAQTIELGLNYAQRALKDEVRLTDTVTRKGSGAVSASLSIRDDRTLFGLDGVNQGMVRFTMGNLDIVDAQVLALDQAAGGARTFGDFAKLNVTLSRSTLLPNAFTLAASLRHQSTLGGKNLDSSERMGISGVGGVMAYPMGEASGTDATLVGLELSRPLPEVMGVQHQWMAFTNWGRTRTLRQDDYRSLSDVGLGWSTRQQNGLLIKAYVAIGLNGHATSEPDPKTRFLLQAGWVF
jgi:hemolysin activation/secretion protein